jgi:flagellar hook-basal body complex protein FliE
MSLSPISGNLSLTPANASSTSNNKVTNVVDQVENSFSSILKNLEDTQDTSDTLLKKLSAGEDVDLSQLMIATEQTDINFKVAMAIRDRLVDAYKEVIRITV